MTISFSWADIRYWRRSSSHAYKQRYRCHSLCVACLKHRRLLAWQPLLSRHKKRPAAIRSLFSLRKALLAPISRSQTSQVSPTMRFFHYCRHSWAKEGMHERQTLDEHGTRGATSTLSSTHSEKTSGHVSSVEHHAGGATGALSSTRGEKTGDYISSI